MTVQLKTFVILKFLAFNSNKMVIVWQVVQLISYEIFELEVHHENLKVFSNFYV